MVFDNVKNSSLYDGLGERIQTALEYLRSNDFEKFEPGRYEIDGENIFAMVQSYNSKKMEEGFWEAHRKYIDIQYVFKGTERMGFENIRNMKMAGEYDKEKDFSLFEGEGGFIEVKAGEFVIFYPQDIHMPGIAPKEPDKVQKVVVKVLAG